MQYKPLKFINESIVVQFDQAPLLEKKPGCPDSFEWRDEAFFVQEIISEWHEYDRKGRMARNMQPTHARSARKQGSWGVGQDYYRVRTQGDRFFEIYFDRAPGNVDQRKGEWFLYRELIEG